MAPTEMQAPRVSGPPLQTLEVEGHGPAVVAVPAEQTGRFPLVVALHGNYDHPWWQCQTWGPFVANGAFVLCLRGVPRADAPKGADRWTFGSAGALKRELDAGIAAVDAKFSDFRREGPITLIGFSLGAIHAARLALAEPRRFPRLVLIEGGEKGWSRGSIGRFEQGGGERVLIVCAQTVCRNTARALEPLFAAAKVDYRQVSALGAGHTYDGPVAELVRENWQWVQKGSPSDDETPVQSGKEP